MKSKWLLELSAITTVRAATFAAIQTIITCKNAEDSGNINKYIRKIANEVMLCWMGTICATF